MRLRDVTRPSSAVRSGSDVRDEPKQLGAVAQPRRRGALRFDSGPEALYRSPSLPSQAPTARLDHDGVNYARPIYSRARVNQAGEQLRLGQTKSKDFDVIGNWRASHAYPLLVFRITLSDRARRIDKGVLIAQRLKRLSSIFLKLERIRRLRLATIQDIGGCRAVVSSADRARRLFDTYIKHKPLKHKLLWAKNYVSEPKESGYRGYHLVYAYRGRGINLVYNDLRIEIQIRSRNQHAWATAVETVDIFTGQALKSSIGRPDWDHFFRLMASFIAKRERLPLVQGTPERIPDLKVAIRECEQRLKVIEHLRDFRHVAEHFDKEPAFSFTGGRKPSYFVLEVMPDDRRITVDAYNSVDLEKAEASYLNTEQSILAKRANNDAVLVSVEKLINLRKAYPNYYGDTDVFLGILRSAIA